MTSSGHVELLGDGRDAVQGVELTQVREVAHLHESLGPDHRPDRHRVSGVEDLAGVVGREEGVHGGLVHQVDRLDRVGQDEAVHAHHDRHREFLGQSKRLHVQVGGLLIGLGEELDPPRVPHGHRVGVIVPDVDRRADGPIGQGHHHGQSQSGGVVDRLHHVEQSLRRRRGVGARTRGGRPERHRHRRELTLDVHELTGRQAPRLHHRADGLDDVGLGRDGVGAHHLGSTQGHGLGDGARPLNLRAHPRPLSRRRRPPRRRPRRRPRCAPPPHPRSAR